MFERVACCSLARARQLLSWFLLSSLVSCSSGAPAGPKTPEWTPQNETKCKVTKSQARPLIVEWPSSDRVTLESSMKDGLVAVHASGCEVEVLAHCKTPGRYGYRGTSKESDAVSISNEDDLYANLPLGAASLSGKLQSSGSLHVSMAVVGRYVVEGQAPSASDLQGDGCERATHYISAVAVGAFSLYAGGSQEAGIGADVKAISGGVHTASKREELKSGGNVGACDAASRKDIEPPDGCGALLRIELIPMPSGKTARTVPPAPGTGTNTRTDPPPTTTRPRTTPPPPATTSRSKSTPTAAPASGWLSASAYSLSFGLLGLSIGGIGALNQQKIAEKECDENNVCTQAGADARSKGRTLAWVANAGAGLTLLGVGLFILAPRPGKPSAAVGINASGVQLAGEF